MILSSFDIITQAVNEDYQIMCSVLVKVKGIFKFKSDDHWLKNNTFPHEWNFEGFIHFNIFFICLLCYLITHFKKKILQEK